MIKKTVLFFLCFILFLSLPSCKKTPPTIPDIPSLIQPTIEYFNANPGSTAYGEASILSWSVKNATTITIDNGIGNVTATGTQEISPEETTTYTLTAKNNDGQKTKSCTVTVASPLPIIEFFLATPSQISPGESSVLSWSVTNATQVGIDYPGSALNAPITEADVGVSGEYIVGPIETAQYKLVAVNDYTTQHGAPVSQNCIVTVEPTALFILTYYSYDYTTYGCCRITGLVANAGNVTGYNVMIEFQAYNAYNTIIDTANGFPANLGNIPVGISATFDAIFFDTYDWAIIAKVAYEITWLNTLGVKMTQTGIVPLK